MRSAETLETKRMEEAEMRKLQEFQKRKLLEREKKKNKIAAHKKIVARAVAKRYLHGAKENTYNYLADTGFFTKRFQVEVLELNVLPWLTKKVEKFVQ